MIDADAIARTYALPFGFVATFSWRDAHLQVDWKPHFPRLVKRSAQRKFLAAYQSARGDFYTDVAAMIGGSILIVDTDGKTIDGTEVIVAPTKQ